MTDLQDAKRLVRTFYTALDQDPAAAVDAHYAPDALWRGYHPFHEIRDPRRVVDEFWTPLRTALTRMQRRLDVFFAGESKLEAGGVWVASMGHLMGLFDTPWLGIRPTGRIAMLRYAEFLRVEDGKIVDTAMYFDIPHLMAQAGQYPFPPQTGAQLVQPGPMTHDGLLFEEQDPEEGRKTLEVIEAMSRGIGNWKNRGEEALAEELPRTWHDDMIWWGPTGIGATYTIERYIKQHSGPFRRSFGDRTFNGHVARIGEGNYGGFFGWPNLTLTPTGGFMGMPGTGKPGDMRVIDIYRRSGDKLSENWIFIDLLHFWKQQGIDVLERMAEV